jgi:hypothetical protein
MSDVSEDPVPRVTSRSYVMLGIIGLCVLGLGGAAILIVYQRATEPPPASAVCAALARRLDAEAATSTGRGQALLAALRGGYPWGFNAPGPGALVDLVSKERLPDTPQNVCLNNLYVWEHNTDREGYGTLVRCLDDAGDVDAVTGCFAAAKQ